ncbi:hypothetical protein BACCOP_00642 [Phocaeicola coprocola DSM 17136]|uniref:Uncharacterized protein n=1 Tax=Phocaeicola coprocola DSM 17136 TaxID=470145 RepID=B3JFJ3_9BACT|nr:hypothetical protein [Phocaeicola coprocola]EDV02243.1 hypothetical protein BACCOP_00642 [Phocaeicola coprocola DSM 17136]
MTNDYAFLALLKNLNIIYHACFLTKKAYGQLRTAQLWYLIPLSWFQDTPFGF